MNEAEIAKIVGQQIEQHGSNNQWIGFVLLAALYVIKTMWQELKDKNKDPHGTEHKELTRMAISHIEERQTEIMEDLKDMRTTLKYIEREIEHLKRKD